MTVPIMSDSTTAPRSSIQIALLMTGAIAGVLFITSFLVLGAVASNYDPMRDTISALEFTDVGIAQRLNFIIFGLLLVCFAFGLRNELHKGRAALLVPFFQLLSGVAVIGDGLFAHNPLHMTCDLIAFNSTIAVLFLFAWRFWGDARWRGWATYSIVTALAMTGFLTAFGIANSHGGPAGAFEKLATVIRTPWSILLVGRFLRGARLS